MSLPVPPMDARSEAREQRVALRASVADSIRIRPSTDADRPRLEAFYARLSSETLYMRFFSASPDAYRRVPPDPAHRFVLVAESDGEIVGTAESVRSASDSTRAEVAFAVLDRMQHRGVATRLLHALAAEGRRRGIQVLTAQVLMSNHAMMSVFRDSGLLVRERLSEGIFDVDVSVDGT